MPNQHTKAIKSASASSARHLVQNVSMPAPRFASMDPSAQPVVESEVARECRRLEEVAAELGQCLQTFEGRLETVLRGKPPMADAASPVCDSLVAENINRAVNSIHQSIGRMRGLMDGLAI